MYYEKEKMKRKKERKCSWILIERIEKKKNCEINQRKQKQKKKNSEINYWRKSKRNQCGKNNLVK